MSKSRIAVYSYNGILHSNGNKHVTYHMDEILQTWVKEDRHKRVSIPWLHLYKIQKQFKLRNNARC